MVKYTKSKPYTSRSRKYASSRQIVNRAAAVLRKRMGGPPLGPVSTRGFYGLWDGRGRNELKSVENAAIQAAPLSNSTGSVTLINGVATGTDYTDRVGRKIIIKSIYIRMTAYPYTTGTIDNTKGECLRLMLVMDTQPNGALAAVADILNGSGDVNAPMNLNNRDRFKVLYDKQIGFPSFTTTSGALVNGSPMLKPIKIYKKCNLEVIFNGTGSTIGSIQTGALLVLQLSAHAAIETLYTARVRFSDG